ncbi:hypothetical protein FIBSPDRAFT_880685 [Athelia psychrophila]|uniref:Uncharacterized protein n=1 Tax=Athelia psychrophila TaxID=1759441 RepID=A0A167SHV9_9AGAM|nr:hypothetical protein FIBSPDRAFT_880685 [Fibularhizoctonia sp. CBS 109695]
MSSEGDSATSPSPFSLAAAAVAAAVTAVAAARASSSLVRSASSAAFWAAAASSRAFSFLVGFGLRHPLLPRPHSPCVYCDFPLRCPFAPRLKPPAEGLLGGRPGRPGLARFELIAFKSTSLPSAALIEILLALGGPGARVRVRAEPVCGVGTRSRGHRAQRAVTRC